MPSKQPSVRHAPSTEPPSRQVVCSRCGTEFTCALEGPCWCSEETARLPMPSDGEDCLCRDCLRKAAEVARTAR
ncbi:cysteine-rich CWC family protein [Bradyrhizobium sp.]|uniref:cysteine-rich CWC family protein n=1 Tax=Bradyrhizobium sp. TaxID=376 RepID=UPI0023A2683B|nr:cysteine-rich CWC family protein [Bradyrhizobium sp.]MDE2379311.1 cysteine-rich CWC family protein [Bradyrhizobium sp.]